MNKGGGQLNTLALLGPFLLRGADGREIVVRSKKAKALLAMLALAPGGVRTRGWLQTMLWGSRFREQAQASLRRELATLCRTLEAAGAADMIKRSTGQIELDLDSLQIDVLGLGVGLIGHPVDSDETFLEGLDLPDCEEFGDWLEQQRVRVADLQRVRPPDAATSPGAIEIAGAPLQPTAELLCARALSLPPKPSLCALPFRALGDRVEPFLGPAMAEEISVTLAGFPSLFVVASGSAAALVDRALGHREIAQRLGVGYVIDGTIMQSGATVRVGVSLIDGLTGDQIWAQAFNGHRDDIFDLQQRIAQAIAPHIHTQIDLRELRGALVNPLRSGDVYALYWRANALFRQWDRAAITEAIDVCETLVAMQPVSGWATSMAAFCHAVAFASDWTDDPPATRRAAIRHYQAAIRHGGEDPAVLGYAAGTLVCIGGDLDVAEKLIAHALTLLPSYQPTLFWGGWVDLARGDAGRARERFELSLRINPMAGARAYTITGIGIAMLIQGDIAQAFDLLREAAEYIPDYPLTIVGLSVAAAFVGNTETARRMSARLRTRNSLDRVLAVMRDPQHRMMLEAGLRFADGAGPPA